MAATVQQPPHVGDQFTAKQTWIWTTCSGGAGPAVGRADYREISSSPRRCGEIAGVKSYVETGNSVGFGVSAEEARSIFMRKRRTRTVKSNSPLRRAAERMRSYNGKIGWIKSPLAVLTDYELSGGDTGRSEAGCGVVLPRPDQAGAENMRVSLPTSISDLPGPSSQRRPKGVGLGQDRAVNVLQGNGPRGRW